MTLDMADGRIPVIASQKLTASSPVRTTVWTKACTWRYTINLHKKGYINFKGFCYHITTNCECQCNGWSTSTLHLGCWYHCGTEEATGTVVSQPLVNDDIHPLWRWRIIIGTHNRGVIGHQRCMVREVECSIYVHVNELNWRLMIISYC